MPQRQPKSRPATPGRAPRVANPQPTGSVYGEQWGRSGKQKPDDKGQKDRPRPIKPSGEPS